MKKYEDELVRIETWMKMSGIQNKEKQSSFGGVHAWYDQHNEKFTFLYSEITGYAVTWYISKYSFTKETIWLQKATHAANWLVEQALDQNNGGVLCRHDGDNWRKLICAFDNGMCLNGLCNIYQCTREEKYLLAAKKIGESLIFNMQKSDGSFYSKFNLESNTICDPGGKWSLISGPFLIKLSIGLMNLAKITNDTKFSDSAINLCQWGIKLQKDNGRFMTSPNANETFLHPHCYAAEGMLCAGLILKNEEYINSAVKAVEWIASEQLDDGSFPAYYNNDGFSDETSPDMTAQVLRLWCMIPSSEKPNIYPDAAIKSILQLQCVSSNVDAHGGIYAGDAWFVGNQNPTKIKRTHVNSWVSMFSSQAIAMYIYGNQNLYHLV